MLLFSCLSPLAAVRPLALALRAFENVTPESRQNMVRIHTGTEKPASTFTSVRYRGHGFRIDDGEWQTNRTHRGCRETALDRHPCSMKLHTPKGWPTELAHRFRGHGWRFAETTDV